MYVCMSCYSGDSEGATIRMYEVACRDSTCIIHLEADASCSDVVHHGAELRGRRLDVYAPPAVTVLMVENVAQQMTLLV